MQSNILLEVPITERPSLSILEDIRQLTLKPRVMHKMGYPAGRHLRGTGYRKTCGILGSAYSLMCGSITTASDIKLATVVVVDLNGYIRYVSAVRGHRRSPSYYNRDKSGIPIQRLEKIQTDLLQFIGRDTVLVGYKLHKDLHLLKLVHPVVLDISKFYSKGRLGIHRHRSLFDKAKTIMSILTLKASTLLKKFGETEDQDSVMFGELAEHMSLNLTLC